MRTKLLWVVPLVASVVSVAMAQPPPVAVHDEPRALPLKPLHRFLTRQMKRAKVTRLSELWGRSPGQLAFLKPGMQREPEDTRPFFRRFDQPTGKRSKGKAMWLQWGFLDGELFRLRLRYRERGPGFAKRFRRALGRAPDRTGMARGEVSEQVWVDGPLTITLRQKGSAFAVTLEGTARLARFRKRLAPHDEAERLVYRSVAHLQPARKATYDNARAIALATRATTLAPRFGDAWVNLCRALYQRGDRDPKPMIAACERASAVTGEGSVRAEAAFLLSMIVTSRLDDNKRARDLRAAARALAPARSQLARDLVLREAGIGQSWTEAMFRRAVYERRCHEYAGSKRPIHIEYGFMNPLNVEYEAGNEGADVDEAIARANRRCRR